MLDIIYYNAYFKKNQEILHEHWTIDRFRNANRINIEQFV